MTRDEAIRMLKQHEGEIRARATDDRSSGDVASFWPDSQPARGRTALAIVSPWSRSAMARSWLCCRFSQNRAVVPK